MSTHILTADIGGSHITAAVFDSETDSLITQTITRGELRSKSSAEKITKVWEDTVKSAIERSPYPVTGMGIAMPGPFDYINGISYITGLHKYEALYAMNVKQYFSELLELPVTSIKFRNDAEAAIAGEVHAGSGIGFENILGLTLGTGFGSAQFLDGITTDLNLGSEPFKDSIADDYLSSRWFIKRYHQLTGISASGVKELAEFAKRPNSAAKQVFVEFADNMSLFLMQWIERLNPQAIIFSGNIAHSSEHFLPAFSKRVNPITIKLAKLGESAALIGAANQFNDQVKYQL